VTLFHNRPLHLCIATANVAVVRKWVEIATLEEIEAAMEVPSSVGTALCMAAALKKAHEEGQLPGCSIPYIGSWQRQSPGFIITVQIVLLCL